MALYNDIMKRVGDSLRALSPSQRAALLLSALLVGVSLAWLASWAASPELSVPLLDQALSADEIARIRAGLTQMNEPHKLVGSQILVRPNANRLALLAQLQLQDNLPTTTATAFDKLVKESNPWIPQEENNRRWVVAYSQMLARALEQFNGVRRAEVFLNLTSAQRGFSRNPPAASAGVTLYMKNGEPVPRNLAIAAARLVSGAVQGLTLQAVNVVDGAGNTALDWQDEADGSGASRRRTREEEREIAAKIRDQLSFIPNVRVNVQVELDLSTVDTRTSTPQKSVAIREKSDDSQRTRSSRGGQPGVEPNTGLAVGGAGGENTETRTMSEKDFVAGMKVENETKPGGGVKEVFAAVFVSRSYLVGAFKRTKPDATPTDADVEAVFAAEKKRIVSQVTKLVKPQTEEKVAVDWYDDSLAAGGGGGGGAGGGSAASAGALETALSMVQQYGAPAGLAVLALVSFSLMLSLSRRTAASESLGLDLGLPREVIDAAKKAAQDASTAGRKVASRAATRDPEALAALQPDVGETLATDGLLVAREIDETTVQINAMLEQVGEMIEQNPDTVASLVEQWTQQSS
ncbi:MAG: hypothetical protein CHACPFDD_00985 [Phycisphaerae bacterium]|nr:hypothetical protein [Phycisphaerae bacterium]